MSEKQDNGETKDWDRFWGSGKVDDYLRYRNCGCQAGHEGTVQQQSGKMDVGETVQQLG